MIECILCLSPLGPFISATLNSVLCLLLTAFQDLQGDVEYYTLFWSSATSNESRKILPDVNSHVIGHLNPNTEYRIFISVFNGVASINSEVLHATTCDGGECGFQGKLGFRDAKEID